MVSGDVIVVGLTLVVTVIFVILLVWIKMWEREYPGDFSTDLTEDEMKAMDEARERLPDKTWEMEDPELGHPMYGNRTYPMFTIHFGLQKSK
jgi:hypothetical protein